MHVAKKLRALADTTDASDGDRAAIRAALQPVLGQLQHDLELVRRALGGPDPEFALSLFLDAMDDVPGHTTALEHALGAATHLRLVA